MGYFGLTKLPFIFHHSLRGRLRVLWYIHNVVLSALFPYSVIHFQFTFDWSKFYSKYLTARHLDLLFFTTILVLFFWQILEWLLNMVLPYSFDDIFWSAVFVMAIHALTRLEPNPRNFLVQQFVAALPGTLAKGRCQWKTNSFMLQAKAERAAE